MGTGSSNTDVLQEQNYTKSNSAGIRVVDVNYLEKLYNGSILRRLSFCPSKLREHQTLLTDIITARL